MQQTFRIALRLKLKSSSFIVSVSGLNFYIKMYETLITILSLTVVCEVTMVNADQGHVTLYSTSSLEGLVPEDALLNPSLPGSFWSPDVNDTNNPYILAQIQTPSPNETEIVNMTVTLKNILTFSVEYGDEAWVSVFFYHYAFV